MNRKQKREEIKSLKAEIKRGGDTTPIENLKKRLKDLEGFSLDKAANDHRKEVMKKNVFSMTPVLRFKTLIKEYKKVRSQRKALKGHHSERIIKDLQKKAFTDK